MEEDRKLRLFAVDSYISLLQGEPGKLPQRFLQVISWVSAVCTMSGVYNYYVIKIRTGRSRRKIITVASVFVICTENLCPLCLDQVLGEYSYLKEELEPATVLRLLAKVLDMKQTSSETKSWVLMAMTKLCQGGNGLSVTQEVSETYSSSMDTVLRQRAQELQHLSQDSDLQPRVLPRDANLEPLEVTYMQGFRITITRVKAKV